MSSQINYVEETGLWNEEKQTKFQQPLKLQ